MEFDRIDELTFNYSDIFFSYYFNRECSCTPMVKDHMLIYIYSGEVLARQGDKENVIGAGECVFIRKDNRVSLNKQPKGDEMFKGIFMIFKRNFLREFYQTVDKDKFPETVPQELPSIIKLPQNPNIEGLFQSIAPYFDSNIKPVEAIMKLKLQEDIFSLLHIDKIFYPILFDFTEPWKIDILDFMEENYMYDLTIEDIAHYTGRSLATFKRDFKKLTLVSPQKWLMNKRLEVANDKIRNENKKISDVYLEVGFKNLSHFSAAYKKHFGHNPSV
ncbi:MAG TPA: AraC family transcriptional regulator [Dysgonomonas sp.]|nr:AraC family transcriptional regulator [Dysgonomonas sp.]